MTVKFHEDAIILYGVSQLAEGTSAIGGGLKSGTISVALNGTAVIGVSTLFLTEVQRGDNLYKDTGESLGRVVAIADDLTLTITKAEVVMAGDEYANKKNILSGTVTTILSANTIIGVGTSFDTQLTEGAYLYTVGGLLIGQIDTVTDDNNALLTVNALVALTSDPYETGLGPKNALAALNLNYSTEITSEAHTYVGDELSRDEETVITDKFAKFDCEVFLPKLGDIAGTDPVESEIPMSNWFQSSGLAAILSTGSQGYVELSNSQITNDYMTIEVRLSSPDIVTDKTCVMDDCRGMIDLDATVGKRAKLKFNYTGNLAEVVQKTPIVADFENQKSGHAASVNSKTVTLSNLEVYDGATKPGVGVTNFCFDKVVAPNSDGFEYDRYQLSCNDGWSKGGTPTDVTATILEDEAGSDYNPDNHLEDNHRLTVRYGSGVGEVVQLSWHKLQLANVSPSTVAKYAGQDLAFRNVGTFDIRLS